MGRGTSGADFSGLGACKKMQQIFFHALNHGSPQARKHALTLTRRLTDLLHRR